ncbi:MAG: phosphotransferase, partial [Actinomycetota bacterium]|nr:phosphotransferase [Actinomycetota bacterium]
MPARKMHAGERDIDLPLVRRLVADQFPRWADLPLAPVHSHGTDNAIYRLGDEMAVRLPRIEAATGQVDKEHLWLAKLAPLLPLEVPVPLAKGGPADGYPWHWSVCRWLNGDDATAEPVTDMRAAAKVLGDFVAALWRLDPAGGPAPGVHNS